MRLANSIRSFIFPPHCAGCGAPGTWICDRCQNLLLIRAPPECFICRKISRGYRTHDTCLAQTAIIQTVICWRYNELAKSLMKKMKYNVRYDIIRHLTELAHELLQPWIPENALLIPVPTTQSRIRERGFNQSVLIAENISRMSSKTAYTLPVFDILRRETSSASQATKNKNERHKLSKNEFYVEQDPANEKSINGPSNRPVFLVDDVCTTGTTLQRCAEVLLDSGFRNISAVALFRGKPQYPKEIGGEKK